jgi:hypothetical protein
MSERKTVTAYVVEQVNWQYNDERYYRSDGANEPERVFLDRRKAEAHALELEGGSHRGWLLGIDLLGREEPDWSSLPRDEMISRLRGAGIEPTEEELADITATYDDWQVEEAAEDPTWTYVEWLCRDLADPERWTEEQLRMIWEVFDRQRNFVVVEMAVELEE